MGFSKGSLVIPVLNMSLGDTWLIVKSGARLSSMRAIFMKRLFEYDDGEKSMGFNFSAEQ